MHRRRQGIVAYVLTHQPTMRLSELRKYRYIRHRFYVCVRVNDRTSGLHTQLIVFFYGVGQTQADLTTYSYSDLIGYEGVI